MEHVTQTGDLVYWLPLDEAARRFGVEPNALVAAARRGEFDVRAKCVGGTIVATISTTGLRERYGPPLAGPFPEDEPGTLYPRLAAPPRRDAKAFEALHGELVTAENRARALELDRARLEGRLETAERVERGLQRYADRLEERRAEDAERLAEAERTRLNLARLVGKLEAEVARLEGRLGEVEAERREAIEAPKARRKRRWWQRG